jgi:hypothetical protein
MEIKILEIKKDKVVKDYRLYYFYDEAGKQYEYWLKDTYNLQYKVNDIIVFDPVEKTDNNGNIIIKIKGPKKKGEYTRSYNDPEAVKLNAKTMSLGLIIKLFKSLKIQPETENQIFKGSDIIYAWLIKDELTRDTILNRYHILDEYMNCLEFDCFKDVKTLEILFEKSDKILFDISKSILE